MEAGLSEIARFLALRPPFGGLAPEELGELVADTQLEFYTGGEVILSEDGGPVTFLRVIHSGAVDIVHDGRLLDILGPGDTFGHAAMLSGLPPGFEARARAARYEALEAARSRLGATALLVGHTRDDQAETVLLNLLRGGAATGLAGIPSRRGPIRRPFVVCARRRCR